MAVANSPVSIPAIPNYYIFVAIQTWNTNGEGFPEILHDIMPGTNSIPDTPTGLIVGSPDEFDAHLTWNNVPYSAGYNIWMRDTRNGANNTWQLEGSTRVNCYNIGFIFAFIEWYEFCAQAWNDDLELPIDERQYVLATKLVSSAPVPTCPIYPA